MNGMDEHSNAIQWYLFPSISESFNDPQILLYYFIALTGYYFCHETDEIEKKIGTSKGPLSFINKSIYLPLEFIFRRQ